MGATYKITMRCFSGVFHAVVLEDGSGCLSGLLDSVTKALEMFL